MLLGATLLPVAAVFSSEDIDLSTSFSHSETTDEGDVRVIPDHSSFLVTRQRDGGYFHHPGTSIGLVGASHVANQKQAKRKTKESRSRQFTLWSKKLLKIAPCYASVVIPISIPVRFPSHLPLTNQPLASQEGDPTRSI